MPVDVSALGIPEYDDIIIERIDLKEIEEIIKNDKYEHISQLERDVYKMIMNSYKFNQKETPVFLKTVVFEEYFIQIMG